MSEGAPIIIKKKKVSHGGHHGGSWKVAYADFVTAMMAFFMVMWIMGLSDQDKALIQGYFQDPLGFVKNEPRAKVSIANFKSSPPRTGPWKQSGGSAQGVEEVRRLDEDQVRQIGREIGEALKEMAQKDGVLKELVKQIELVVTPEGLRMEFIEGAGAVFFDSGCAVIRPEARRLIQRVAPLIAKSGRKLVIEGHTDARPYPPGRNYDNWDLSNDRAQAMRRLLKASGVPEDRVIEVRGFAATRLRRPDRPFDYSNRRVTVLLSFEHVEEKKVGMPSADLESRIQGLFRRPVDIAPDLRGR
ncbi:MAG: OmpA family protein [Fimbriimonadales bacterium]|nr:OmpA family protein [Fimbriimonadales bacterium]